MGWKVSKLLCLFGLHRPTEAETRRSVTDYVSRCSGCGAKLLKRRFSSRWAVARDRAPRRRSSRGR